jgi:phosphohistidine phosphatase SixA
MSAQHSSTPRFIRKTQLAAREYRKNFHQIDREIIEAVTSPEADEVTPLMSKIYLRLVNAPARYWEREGVLRFEEEFREGSRVKAWSVLCSLLRVSSATANKAITWMHSEGLIGYFSGKNGVGLRIFFNRAASSIGLRPAQPDKKILDFPRASSANSPASPNETAFRDTYGNIEIPDIDLNSDAPKNGANSGETDGDCSNRMITSRQQAHESDSPSRSSPATTETGLPQSLVLGEIMRRLKVEIEPSLRAIANQAAARESDRTRDWLEKKGLPKAARVAQREAYNVLKHHGVIIDSARRARSELSVGSHGGSRSGPRPLSRDEIKEVAEICVSMFEAQAQLIDTTLNEISAEAGGYLLAGDVPKVRELAHSMISATTQSEFQEV